MLTTCIPRSSDTKLDVATVRSSPAVQLPFSSYDVASFSAAELAISTILERV